MRVDRQNDSASMQTGHGAWGGLAQSPSALESVQEDLADAHTPLVSTLGTDQWHLRVAGRATDQLDPSPKHSSGLVDGGTCRTKIDPQLSGEGSSGDLRRRQLADHDLEPVHLLAQIKVRSHPDPEVSSLTCGRSRSRDFDAPSSSHRQASSPLAVPS